MDINTLGKSVSIFLKKQELELLKKLEEKGIKRVDIFRRGLQDLLHENDLSLDT